MPKSRAERIIEIYGPVDALFNAVNLHGCPYCAHKVNCKGEAVNADRCSRGIRNWLVGDAEEGADGDAVLSGPTHADLLEAVVYAAEDALQIRLENDGLDKLAETIEALTAHRKEKGIL